MRSKHIQDDGDGLMLLDFESSFGIPPPESPSIQDHVTNGGMPGQDISEELKSRRGADLDASELFQPRADTFQEGITERQFLLPSPCATIKANYSSSRLVRAESTSSSTSAETDSPDPAAETVAAEPPPQVDYFTHDWTADQLIESQKSLQHIPMTTESNMAAMPTERVRLTNCLWRNWWRFLRDIPSVPSHRGSWEEDFDPLFLYGPATIAQSKVTAPGSPGFSELKRTKSILKNGEDARRQRLAIQRLGLEVKSVGGNDRRVEFNFD